MKPFIVAIAVLSLFLAACGQVSPTLVTPTEPASPSEGTQFPSANRLEKSPTQTESLTSEYIPGSTPSAIFESFVSARELSTNGVEFTSVSLSELSFSMGPFAYISRKHDENTTIYTMDIFTNPLVAEYEATRVEVLNLFLIHGDKAQAKKNMAQWCEAQGPQTQEEAQTGVNQVICFQSSAVE
jgi:hypothetical protein